MQNIPESPTDEENHVVVTTADKEFSFRAQHWQVKLFNAFLWHPLKSGTRSMHINIIFLKVP